MSHRPSSDRVAATTEHRYPDPATGPWVLTLRWALVDGVPEVVAMTLLSDPAERLSESVLRGLNVARRIASDRAGMIRAPAPTLTMRTSKRERYERVAETYRAAMREGRPPVKAVAAAEQLSQGGASALVARVREAGLLPPTSAGVAMGEIEGERRGQ